MSLTSFADAFNLYPKSVAPFLHAQFEWAQQEKPFKGMRIAHHVPLVPNTLMKIACLHAGGAELVVSNPSFLKPHQPSIEVLQREGVAYCDDIQQLKGQEFDVLLDCNAELAKVCTPTLGAVELTRGGDIDFRAFARQYPVISVDASATKALETCLGTGDGVWRALNMLLPGKVEHLNTVGVFGFGKVGQGVAHALRAKGMHVIVFESHPNALALAEKRGYAVQSADNKDHVHQKVNSLDLVVTATGVPGAMSEHYQAEYFKGKVLVNAGVSAELGPDFEALAPLNGGMPINFLLEEPTATQFIDPIMYLHTKMALYLKPDMAHQVYDLPKEVDQETIAQWLVHHPEFETTLRELELFC